MSTWEEDLARVVGLAIEVEDRDRSEQASLLRVAHWVDRRMNAQTIGNKHADETYQEPSRLARAAGCDKEKCKPCTSVPDRSVPNADGTRSIMLRL